MTSYIPHSKQVETLNYRKGGFHPVHLGDQFKKDRYTVIHKLGHGGFATVWLARDLNRSRYVALKILAARLSHDCPEVEILRRLRGSEEHRGKAFVMSMLDHFWIDGPNGNHLCVVSEVGGPSIKQFNDCPGLVSGSRRLRASVARQVALQATEGLAYIHSTGTVHGDYTSANILLKLANIDEWTVEQIHERLGEPRTQELPHVPGLLISSRPRYTVDEVTMKEVDPQWLSDQIMIIDFGIAFLQDQSSPDIGTPKNYCAPEFLFKSARSVSSDVWALGCTIFEIRTGSGLFRYQGTVTRDQRLIAMVKLLGPLPEKWWDEWKEGREWYANETRIGGELAETVSGTLFLEIMKIGVHDGDSSARSSFKDQAQKLDVVVEEGGMRQARSVEEETNATNQLIALVGEITTSEAAEVIALVNEPRSGSPDQKKPDSAGSNKNESGSSSSNAKANSGSSNAKSGEKSISSEGISTGASASNLAPPMISEVAVEGIAVVGLVKELDKTGMIEEFLEQSGTIIAMNEAESLEDLLRKALMHLPEERFAASALAKHHWFLDEFPVAINELSE